MTDETEPEKKITEKYLFIAMGIIFLLAAGLVSLRFFLKSEPKTIDDLHLLNLEGKLKPEQGYIYNGFSFVNADGFWYTQINSPNDRIRYSLMFRFSPKELEDLKIQGRINQTFFDNSPDYYVTFDPLGTDFSYVAAAINDFNQHMMKTFKKTPIAACSRNETSACKTRPIVNCDNDKLVFYVNESATTSISLSKNCILIAGSQIELIRAVDRMLYIFYGVME